ncbi:MAG: hypothetical protein ACE37F_18230 [Nannocystaceae bacterium]|nr:hypothetical protein [bacterium]
MKRWGLALGLAAGLASPGVAHAHHVPGHGASEGVRNLNSLGGGSGQATSRLMLLQEYSRNTTSLNPATTYNTSLLGEYAPHPWVSVGVQAPLLVVDEDAAPRKVGYGDTRAFVRLTPHADKLIHRVVTTGLNVSVPTRTLRFEADPGQSWTVSPLVMFTRTHLRTFWQVMALSTLERRPAGTAIDATLSAQIGYRAWGKLGLGVGALADVRAANFCAQVGGGSEYCSGNRATETNREVGAFRMAHLTTLSYSFATWGMVAANLQLPLTPKRDFDAAGSLSVQFQF